MKMLCAVVILVLVSFSCGGGSSSDGASDYILQPGSLSTTTDPLTFEKATLSYPGKSYSDTALYAVIYKGTVNGVNYIGISVDEDGKTTTTDFNLKLYFQGSDIPFGSTKTFTSGTENFSIRIVDSGGNHSTIDAGNASITLNFSTLNTTNNTITITGTGYGDDTISVDSNPLVIGTITAYYYNASQ
jgi:hypothetical protein